MTRNLFVRVSQDDLNLIDKVKDAMMIKYPERKSIPRGEAVNYACKNYFGYHNSKKNNKEMTKLF